MRALLLFFLFFTFVSRAEDTTTVQTDSVPGHSIKKAVILSAVVPGAGQIYNHLAMPKGQKKAFWKVPLIYAGLGATSYFLITNQQQKNLYRSEYEFRQEYGAFNDLSLSVYDDQALVTLHDQYLSWRDMSILALGAVYLIQVVDAGVEAHFVSFDVSEDLSMSFQPTMLNPQTAGLSLRLNFH